jgi:hypothetical protein
VELSHYRDHSKFEVDAVLENRAGQVVGIEVKAVSTVGLDDFRGLRRLADRLGDDFQPGDALHRHRDPAVRRQTPRHPGQRAVDVWFADVIVHTHA